MKIPQSFPMFFAFCLRWLGGEVDKPGKKTQTPSSLYSSVHFLVVNQLVGWSV